MVIELSCSFLTLYQSLGFKSTVSGESPVSLRRRSAKATPPLVLMLLTWDRKCMMILWLFAMCLRSFNWLISSWRLRLRHNIVTSSPNSVLCTGVGFLLHFVHLHICPLGMIIELSCSFLTSSTYPLASACKIWNNAFPIFVLNFLIYGNLKLLTLHLITTSSCFFCKKCCLIKFSTLFYYIYFL